MSVLLDNLSYFAKYIWPIAAFFTLLAIVTKRERILDAVLRVRREFTTNVGLALVNTVLLAQFFAFFSNTVHGWLGTHAALVEFWSGTNNLWSLIVALAALEFAGYWRHRLEHMRWFWPIHATHHADEKMHWMTLLRKHPLGHMLSAILDGIFAILLGLPVDIVVLASVLRTWWGFFTHADVPWTLGIMGEFMISPAAHRLHHIRDEELMGSNYSNTFTFWDRVFGTYVDPRPYLNCETGINEGTRGFLGELLRPFERRYWGRAQQSSLTENEAI
ncbi:sterol desaturase family protein [Altererythrobacter sp.]|uniref:sterol desaturase family protein n=1 Tax=Altererythrobacter sp. TaxID=1872480 RepID=UPI001B119237|nr:sterol desaturase family protein [Altererythrobacter sp.]MBO6608083.1 sterol desaturase family protein [Altererythrobacter sp.]MBO6641661.1 sterol desaturase family protein [Altererythrobacter sp.]MBO6707640.1 sterol desaturase family protein [Altererythrobacter sp.]